MSEMKVDHSDRPKCTKAFGIDPVDRCNPPICYEEHSITVDCGHGRNGAGVLIFQTEKERKTIHGNQDTEKVLH